MADYNDLGYKTHNDHFSQDRISELIIFSWDHENASYKINYLFLPEMLDDSVIILDKYTISFSLNK